MLELLGLGQLVEVEILEVSRLFDITWLYGSFIHRKDYVYWV